MTSALRNAKLRGRVATLCCAGSRPGPAVESCLRNPCSTAWRHMRREAWRTVANAQALPDGRYVHFFVALGQKSEYRSAHLGVGPFKRPKLQVARWAPLQCQSPPVHDRMARKAVPRPRTKHLLRRLATRGTVRHRTVRTCIESRCVGDLIRAVRCHMSNSTRVI